LAEVLSFGFLAVLAETANRKRFAKASIKQEGGQMAAFKTSSLISFL
jgi:hypothetical protein